MGKSLLLVAHRFWLVAGAMLRYQGYRTRTGDRGLCSA